MKAQEKSFDCVQFVREQRDRFDAMFAKMTTEEILAYFRESERASKMRLSA